MPHRTVGNKEVVLSECAEGTQELAMGMPLELSTEGAGTSALLLVFSWKEVDCIFYRFLPEGPASN